MAAMEVDTTRVLLITANIATCFEQPDTMLVAWLDQLLKGVAEHQPGFLALHCQEVGGKNYLSPTNTTKDFLKLLLARSELQDYTRSLIYLDETTTAADKFTALGNLYFIHKDAGDVKTWNFKERRFVDVDGRQQFTGCIEDVATKEKAKFPQQFFPECKWSRKGFMRTRWAVNGTLVDLVNIHLFHDASNFMAMKEFPSVYTLNRRRALHHTLDRFHNDDLENVPFFMFGDFNFRLDTKSVVEMLTRNCSSVSSPGSRNPADEERRYYRPPTEGRGAGSPELTVSKRSFKHVRHQTVFREKDGDWLRPFDQESSSFSSRLCEMPITFPPSYPFVEEPDVLPASDPPQQPPNGQQRGLISSSSTLDGGGRLSTTSNAGADSSAAILDGSVDANHVFEDAVSPDTGVGDDCGCAVDDHEEEGWGGVRGGVVGHHYAYTRLPGWCDRVMISAAARKLIAQTEQLGVTYQLLGLDTPMGDHKPVSLLTRFPRRQGVVACCSPPTSPPCTSFVHNPKLGKRCYSAEHPWCLCQHYPTCPAASKMAATRVNSNKMAASQATSGGDVLATEGAVTSVVKGLASEGGGVVATSVTSSEDTLHGVSHCNLSNIAKLESSASVPKEGASDCDKSSAPNTNSANDQLPDIVLDESRTCIDTGCGSGPIVTPTEGGELIPNISVTSSSSCSSLSGSSIVVVVNSDQTDGSIVSNESRAPLTSFDVPTIVTSCTSDLDVSISPSYTVSGDLVIVGGACEAASLPLPSTHRPSSDGCSSSSFEIISVTNKSDTEVGLSPNRSDNDLSLPGTDGGGDKRRRHSLLSVDTCDDRGCSSGCGRQCVCSSDETRSRRCSDASILDFSDGRKNSTHVAPTADGPPSQACQVTLARAESIQPEEKVASAEGPKDGVAEAAGGSHVDEAVIVPQPSEDTRCISVDGQADVMDTQSEQQSVTASETKSMDLSIQSVDSEVSSLLSGDALSTLLRNRFKKYEKSVFDPNSDTGFDDLSVTSSMRVEYDSNFEDSTLDLEHSTLDLEPTEKSGSDGKSLDSTHSRQDSSKLMADSASVGADHNEDDETTQLITKTRLSDSISGVIDDRSGTITTQSSVDYSRKFSGLSITKSLRSQSSRIEDECASLTLSADLTDDATSATDVTVSSENNVPAKSDLYTKLELMRKSKRAAEPQHSMNNLLMSDSGSEQVSFSARQPSESSLSGGLYSEGDSVSCRSRKTGGGGPNKDYYESASQVLYTSEDSASCKSGAGQPSRDPESASQNMVMYTTSEDSTSYSKSLLSREGRRPTAARVAGKDPESVSQTPTYDIADLESIGRRVVSSDGKGGGGPTKAPSKGLRSRRRVLPTAPGGGSTSSLALAGDRTSIVSTATTSTTRPPVKCCCLLS